MPYIKKENRYDYQEGIKDLVFELKGATIGELNYVLSSIIKQYLGTNPDYAKFAGVDGTLGLIQAEIRRRQIFPYEDKKIGQNGDI